MTRTFIALELDTNQQLLLANEIRQGKQLLPDLSWVDPAGIHLTMAFLGELNDRQLARAIVATHEACAERSHFTYRLSGLGSFGPVHQPRVLWMGVNEESGALNALHKALSLALAQQGFPSEERPFSPHLTLARVKSSLSAEQLQQFQQLSTRHYPDASAYRVTHLNIMKSELFPTGPIYTSLEVCPFKQS